MFGLGSIVEKVCDTIGLPEEVGDLAAIATDAYTGNYVGVTEHSADLLEVDLPTEVEYGFRAYDLSTNGPASTPT